MKIQVDIPKDINKLLKLLKVEKDLLTLQATLIWILQKYFQKGCK